MGTSIDRFCTFCDPTTIKADEWCSECDAFLCPDCIRHHRASKLLNKHSTILVKHYEELPDFVKTLSYTCSDHEEKIDSFCPVHNSTCCIRCALTSHKSCEGVAPLKDFIRDSKNCQSMKDIEQTLDDMNSYIEKLEEDKEKNKQEMCGQKGKILDEIRKIRTSLNNHLDQLEQTLINSLNETVSETFCQIDGLIEGLKDSNKRIHNISQDILIIKDKATDLQIFLSMSNITSKVNEEEKYIQELGKHSQIGRKAVVFGENVEDLMNAKSFGVVQIKDIKCSIDYVKEKDKEAQIVGLPQQMVTRIFLKQINTFKVKVARGYPCNIIAGCEVLANGNFLFSEYNASVALDRLTLCNNKGFLIQKTIATSADPLYDVVKMDENTYAVSAGCSIKILNITTGTLKYGINQRCYGITFKDGAIIFCCRGEGIRIYNTSSETNTLLIKENIQEFSYVCSTGNRVIYTTGTESVTCCDMAGRVTWKYEDISVLRSPRGVAVDKDGNCYVSGEKSGNIILISPDGKYSKEVCKVMSPRAICYDETRNQILVCKNSEAFLFQISQNV